MKGGDLDADHVAALPGLATNRVIVTDEYSSGASGD